MSAVAFSAPTPGIESNRRAVASLRAFCTISSSKASIRRSSSAHCARMTDPQGALAAKMAAWGKVVDHRT
jgi:hypothetical protein